MEDAGDFKSQISDSGNHKSEITNPKSRALPQRTVNLLPYQRRWVEDDSKLKIVVKARQIGYSFAATLRAVWKCLERKTTWIFLSKGERQSRLLMEKVHDHIRSCGVVARCNESTFFEGTALKQLEVRFSNGSVIYGLPANPDTARGYSGHVTLDEFAFHADADKIYAALFPSITRGYGLEVISTPNGTQGKFYELAKAAGLVDAGLVTRDSGFGLSFPRTRAPVFTGATSHGEVIPAQAGIRGDDDRPSESRVPSPESLAPTWSAHLCDIYDAVKQGLKVDINLLRSGCEDPTAWQQEFCCQFVSTAENFFSPELLAACLSAEAGLGVRDSRLGTRVSGLRTFSDSGPLPGGESGPGLSGPGEGRLFASPESRVASPEFFLGIDIGRRHDRTVFWVDEVQVLGSGDRGLGSITPSTQHPVPSTQERIAVARIVRTLDNAPFAEQLQAARELLSLTVAAMSSSPHDAGGDTGATTHESPFLIRRACIDATGIGAHMAESLEREFGPRVEPVVFTAAVKEDLAFRTKRRMEARLTLLPDTREIRRAFSAVKKFITPSGNLRFDAVRTEAGHADEFWAKALADLAADPEAHRAASVADDGFLADATPIVSPMAFREVEASWSALEVT